MCAPNDRLAVRGRRTGERVSTVAVALCPPKVRLAVQFRIRAEVRTSTVTPAECDWNAPVAVMAYRAGERTLYPRGGCLPVKGAVSGNGDTRDCARLYLHGRCLTAKRTTGSYGDTGGFTYPHLHGLPYARRMHHWRQWQYAVGRAPEPQRSPCAQRKQRALA